MVPESLSVVTGELPYRLRADVEDYVNAVDAALPEIAAEVRIDLDSTLREQFLFLVGVRRLWGAVNGSHWMASNSTALLSRMEAPRLQAGSLTLGPGSEFSAELARLRSSLLELLERTEALEPVELDHVSEVLVWLSERR